MEIRNLILPLLLLSLLFSCSTEESDSKSPPPERASLVLGAVLNKVVSPAFKQQMDGACDSLIPTFADVVVSQDGEMVAGTMDEPLRVKINGTPSSSGGYFTDDSSTLFLEPGICVLEHFSVLDDDGEIIWIAPMQSDENSTVVNLVSKPLPMDIDLQAGGQQYVDVEVVCFDDRVLNSYGYVFADIETMQTIEFCIFGSLCDENGRHQAYTEYRVSVWNYSGDPQNPQVDSLHIDLENELQEINYEDHTEISALPLCFSLPDTHGEDLYYLEISLKDSTETIRSGVFSDVKVKELFTEEGSLDYFHFRGGNCNLEDTPFLLTEFPNS